MQAVGDVTNDGRPDLVAWTDAGMRLLRNMGNLRFLVSSYALSADGDVLADAPVASADTHYVDAHLATGTNDGTSWANAFQGPDGLQVALGVAVAGDRVFVAQGTYRPSSAGVREASVVPPSGVEIYGSFLGGETSPEERPAHPSATSVLSGDLNGDDPSVSDNSYHVIDGAGADARDLSAHLAGYLDAVAGTRARITRSAA